MPVCGCFFKMYFKWQAPDPMVEPVKKDPAEKTPPQKEAGTAPASLPHTTQQDTPQNTTTDKIKPHTFPPETAANNAAAEVKTATGEQAGVTLNWRERMKARIKTSTRTSLRFGKELMHEHEFWVHTLAVKGGVSAIAVAGVLGISYVVALPFMLAATGIAVCGAMVGLGIYGMVAGSARSWYRLRKMYANATGKPMPKRPVRTGKNWLQRQCERPQIKKTLDSKPVIWLRNSRAWKLAQKFTQGQQDNLLGGLAVGGAALSLTVGVIAVATQLAVLPVVAVGGLLTFATVMGASYVISGISGLYFGITGVRHMREKKKAKAAAAAAAQEQPDMILDLDDLAPANSAIKNAPATDDKTTAALPEKINASFKEASDKPAATPAPAANDNPTAKPKAEKPAAVKNTTTADKTSTAAPVKKPAPPST